MGEILRLLFILLVAATAFGGAQDSSSNATESRNGTPDDPTETQKATCTITSGDVKAQAEAFVERKLEGVCGSKEMKDQFRLLEAKVMHELYMIRMMLVRQGFPNIYYPLPTQPTPIPTNPPTTTQSPTTQKPQKESFVFPDLAIRKATDPTTTTESMKLHFQPIELKSLEKSRPRPTKANNRDKEVHTFNNTVISAGEAKIFTYFWKIEKFAEKLRQNVEELMSPVFTISGLNLRVRAKFNHLSRDFFYIQLEQVPIELFKSNVVLETGDELRNIETKKLFKHKIIIMDQGTPSTDIISHEFWNTNSGFPIPISTLLASPYSRNDSLLIRIVIYL